MVLASVPFSNTATGGSRTVVLQLFREAVEIYKGDTAGSRLSGSALRPAYASNREMELGSFVFLDSPSSASALTYKFKIRTVGGTAVVGRSGDDEDNVNGTRRPSSLTLMEVAG